MITHSRSIPYDLGKLERIMKALANRRRLTMVQYLKKNKEASVTEIADAIRLSIKATSKHLGILVAAEIFEREQRSVNMFYRITKNVPAPAQTIFSFL